MRIHIFLGHSKGQRDDDEECFYCSAKPDVLAYTYFGMPLCKNCWDNDWRVNAEDGKTDPPFDEFHNESSGYWVD